MRLPSTFHPIPFNFPLALAKLQMFTSLLAFFSFLKTSQGFTGCFKIHIFEYENSMGTNIISIFIIYVNECTSTNTGAGDAIAAGCCLG